MGKREEKAIMDLIAHYLGGPQWASLRRQWVQHELRKGLNK